jgi:predicted transcriptional regulator
MRLNQTFLKSSFWLSQDDVLDSSSQLTRHLRECYFGVTFAGVEMASTTTLKISDELKQRVATIAQASGKTPHAFMVEALEVQARLAEMRQSFLDDALASAAEVDAGGALYAMEDVQRYILKRTSGKVAKRPKTIVRSDVQPKSTRTRKAG